MDLFMVQTKFRKVKSTQLEKCGKCKKKSLDEILGCSVYHNITEDCFRWQEEVAACTTYQQRLDVEKSLLNKLKDGKRFSRFWNKSGYQFLISEMGLLDQDQSDMKKSDVLGIYDSIIT